MTTAEKVADYLISKSVKEGTVLTNKRLQKLLYYIQAWHLALNKEPLFSDKIEAWIHGPAIRSIYEKYKHYVASPIKEVSNVSIEKELGETTTKFIDVVVSAYSKYDTATLEYMTHAESPWQIARKGLEINESSDNEITMESMRLYYSERLVATK